MATKAGGKVEQAGDSAALEALVRIGLIAYGVVHLLIGWLALQIASGASARKSADSSGALRTLADQPASAVWFGGAWLHTNEIWAGPQSVWRDKTGTGPL